MPFGLLFSFGWIWNSAYWSAQCCTQLDFAPFGLVVPLRLFCALWLCALPWDSLGSTMFYCKPIHLNGAVGRCTCIHLYLQGKLDDPTAYESPAALQVGLRWPKARGVNLNRKVSALIGSWLSTVHFWQLLQLR